MLRHIIRLECVYLADGAREGQEVQQGDHAGAQGWVGNRNGKHEADELVVVRRHPQLQQQALRAFPVASAHVLAHYVLWACTPRCQAGVLPRMPALHVTCRHASSRHHIAPCLLQVHCGLLQHSRAVPHMFVCFSVCPAGISGSSMDSVPMAPHHKGQ